MDARIGEHAAVVVRTRSTGRDEVRGTVEIQDLRGVVTHTMALDGPNGPQGAVTQYILAQAEKYLYDQLQTTLGPRSGTPEREPGVLARLVPLDSFGPDVLDVSRNNLRRRWATTADWLDDLVAYALRPGRAVGHARSAVDAANNLVGAPLGDLVRAVAAGEVAAVRDPARFRLADILRTVLPDHPAVRRSAATLDEYAMTWWLPAYGALLDAYRLRLIDGLSLEEFVWPLFALVDHEARSFSPALDGAGARAILTLIAGATVDAGTGERCTPTEIDRRLPTM